MTATAGSALASTRPGRLPPGLPLGSRDRGLPDRGRGHRGRPRPVDLGHVRAHVPGHIADGVRRSRRLRPLPPLARGPRPARLARRRVPTGSRCRGRASCRAAARGSSRAAWTSTTGSSTGCSRAASSRWRRSTTGTCRSRWRTPVAGPNATPPSGSPTSRSPRTTASATGCASWITLNEPWCSAFLGYASGAARARPPRAGGRAARRPPPAARARPRARRRCARPARGGARHHAQPLPRAPGERGRGRRRRGPPHRRAAEPHLPRPGAARQLSGGRARRPTDRGFDLDHVQAGDLEIIGAPIDVLGVNYYSSFCVRARQGCRSGRGRTGRASPWVGCDDVDFVSRRLPLTHMDWEVDPDGLRQMLVRLARDYACPPLVITENGAAYRDLPATTGEVDDPERIEFVEAHLRAAPRPSARAWRCAATSCGRCWTTSSGPGATAGGSASCTSTSRPSSARRSPAPTAIARSSPPTDPARLAAPDPRVNMKGLSEESRAGPASSLTRRDGRRAAGCRSTADPPSRRPSAVAPAPARRTSPTRPAAASPAVARRRHRARRPRPAATMSRNSCRSVHGHSYAVCTLAPRRRAAR